MPQHTSAEHDESHTGRQRIRPAPPRALPHCALPGGTAGLEHTFVVLARRGAATSHRVNEVCDRVTIRTAYSWVLT